MSALGDDLRDIAAQVDALGAGGAPLWPSSSNLIAGTEPSPPSINIAGEFDSGAVNLIYHDRLCNGMPDGSVIFIGDSLIQAMPVCAVSPFGINLGYGGRSTRRLLHHMTNAAHKGALARAGAGVLLTGAVDCGNTAYYGSATGAWATTLLMIESHIKNWITGPWVIIKPLPGDQRVLDFPQDYNFAMDNIGAGIDSAYSGISNIAIVDAKSALVDGTGNLDSANHIGDGQHLSKAGYDVLCPLIKTALATVL